MYLKVDTREDDRYLNFLRQAFPRIDVRSEVLRRGIMRVRRPCLRGKRYQICMGV